MRKLMIVLIFSFESCGEAEDLNYCVDPIGMDLYSVGNQGWFCFLPQINGCFMLQSATPSFIASVAVQGHTAGTIVDAGQVRCLGDVVEKPTAGYAATSIAQAGHGYVVKFPDGSYARFFIVSAEKNSSGQISKINVTRQYGF